MPATPNITLTATLETIAGAAAGSTANAAKLRIALCGFGPSIPTIAGTAIIASTGPNAFYSTGTPISTLIYGNDQITPAGTFYSIEVLDGEDNVVQCDNYQLTGSGTQDLSNLTPMTPPAAQPGGYILAPAAAGALVMNAAGSPGGLTVDVTLANNVTSSSLGGVFAGERVQFIIRQGASPKTWTWPANFVNPPLVNPAANSVSTSDWIVDYLGNFYPSNGWN
jgi:hypothetical protein